MPARRSAIAAEISATTHAPVPTIERTKIGLNPGMSITASCTAAFASAESPYALRRAKPVAMPAAAS
jgi:hypothetical protein